MTLSPSLRGGSSHTGAILPRRPPRLGEAGFTDPVGPGFIKRAIRSRPSPSRRLESRSSPPELTLFCAVPTALSPFPQPPTLPRTQTPPPRFAAGVPPCPYSAAVLGSGAPTLSLHTGWGHCVRGPEFYLLDGRQVRGSWKNRNQSQGDTSLEAHPTAIEEKADFGFPPGIYGGF